MTTVSTSIAIAAPAATVWGVLTDFAAYPQWNPFVRSLSGDLRIGGRLDAEIGAPGAKPTRFKPVVEVLEPERRLIWRGSLPIPGLFIGRHAFEIEPDASGIRFLHSERFGGLLVTVLAKMLTETEAGFNAMNAALKARAEGRS